MDGAEGVLPGGLIVTVVRRVRVRVSVERVGGEGGRGGMGRLKVGWELVVGVLVIGPVDAGSRMEKVVMMVRVPSVGTGV